MARRKTTIQDVGDDGIDFGAELALAFGGDDLTHHLDIADLEAALDRIDGSRVDETGVPDEMHVGETIRSPFPVETCIDETVSAADEIKVDEKRRGGRPRVHDDDQARKREWARKKRAEVAAATDPAEPKSKGGRPRLYASQADRQRAYEARRKLRLVAANPDEI